MADQVADADHGEREEQRVAFEERAEIDFHGLAGRHFERLRLASDGVTASSRLRKRTRGGRPGYIQSPPLQLDPGAQELPQAPQCTVLVFKSKQPPLHIVGVVPPQVRPQAPLEQTSPLSQALSQTPQCALLVSVSTHPPPHSVGVAPPQLSSHALAEQTVPGSHSLPQSPQLSRSV